ncbi:crotonobetainyl-CoA:carnitine CoA-transferase CaiB-like acyl-CoA transferase [Povalibacter uvarum]|uniref:Crotonobetainyl-CoA:carnitine CoA-transferase CaiB-like acyl-CoA transferase n=1 Tax=Povalibacter uvarum TaxID=732238 RepID=A0A841HM27_9GAMM|nr:CoA transferase [Povalibacter uvarum]MBB6093803.1 crotonobetainyl-CoA:carnitine CoA-transferase CaiB-like acyl-CoA transferase [Povalibacter uvarum]
MLSHLKVIDLAVGLGDYTGRLLAELGAHVVRVEQRACAAEHAVDIAWNISKTRVTLDLESASGREQLLSMAADVDIVIRNAVDKPVDHAALERRNPRVVDVVVAPFDPAGPNAARPATDLTLMARSGLANIVGDPDRAPMTLPGEQAYALAGAHGVVAALTALHARAATGRGELVTISAFQAAVLANYREPVMWQFAQRIGKRTGNLLVRGKSGVRQVWRCRDGYVTWSFVDNPAMMRSLVKVMNEQGVKSLLDDIEWASTLIADSPRETVEAWERIVEEFFSRHTRNDLARWSVERGFGLSQIDGIDDVLASEQLRERSMWRTITDPRSGKALKIPGPLFVTSGSGRNAS